MVLRSTNAKPGLHPRNRHRTGYDFTELAKIYPELKRFVRKAPLGHATIDFADPAAVTALNRALLQSDYGISSWDIPNGYLCPPIPGRADYIHHVADLLGDGQPAIPRGSSVLVLDVGVGANCIYPIIGVSEYGWRFVGSDIDPTAVGSARRIVAANASLRDHVDIRPQPSSENIFHGVVQPGECFTLSMCNPPFHASREEAAAGTRRKLRNLAGGKSGPTVLNFGGRNTELWCKGGETGFVQRMIAQSAKRPNLCRWFTTLVSKQDSLPAIYRALEVAKADHVRTIPLAQGQKKSRVVAWSFRPVGRDVALPS
jgi:23S rRNA (adenine1618-N6)-methyltransferase